MMGRTDSRMRYKNYNLPTLEVGTPPEGAQYHLSGLFLKIGARGRVYRWLNDEWLLSIEIGLSDLKKGKRVENGKIIS